MRGVFCPSDSHHVRRHLENPLNFRPLFFRIEKMMRKYPREICGETASQNTPDTGITSIGGADRRFGYPPPPPPGQWGTNPDFSGGAHQQASPPGESSRLASFHDLIGLLWAGTDRPQEAPDLPNLGSHGLAQVHALASPAPMPEIAIALAPRSARASRPSVHAAAWPTCYRCLSTGVTGSRPRSTAPSFGQIREPSFDVSLTYGVVCHS